MKILLNYKEQKKLRKKQKALDEMPRPTAIIDGTNMRERYMQLSEFVNSDPYQNYINAERQERQSQ